MNRTLTAATAPTPARFGPLLYTGNLDRAMAGLARHGYDGIEISLRDPGEVDRAQLPRRLAAAGLRVTAVGTGRAFLEDGLTVLGPPEVRDAAVRRLKEFVSLAAELGAAVIFGTMRGRTLPPGGWAEAKETLTETLGQIAVTAERHGVRILVEPINRYETELIPTAAQALELCEAVDSPALGLLLDTFHMNIEEVDIAAAIRGTAARLAYVHLADSNRWAPGCGHTNFAAVRAALDNVGYTGPIGIEVLPRPDDDTAAGLAAAFCRKLFA